MALLLITHVLLLKLFCCLNRLVFRINSSVISDFCNELIAYALNISKRTFNKNLDLS